MVEVCETSETSALVAGREHSKCLPKLFDKCNCENCVRPAEPPPAMYPVHCCCVLLFDTSSPCVYYVTMASKIVIALMTAGLAGVVIYAAATR